MPEEVQSRFKGLKVLYDRVNAVEEEEEKEYRQLEIKYEKMYQQVYEKRVALLTGKADIDEELVKRFEERKELVSKEEKYSELECEICDVKDIQNMEKGVSGFWLRAMLAN